MSIEFITEEELHPESIQDFDLSKNLAVALVPFFVL
jgi:hypothetical protein